MKSRVKHYKVYNHKTGKLKECYACSSLEAVQYFKWDPCDCTVMEIPTLKPNRSHVEVSQVDEVLIVGALSHGRHDGGYKFIL